MFQGQGEQGGCYQRGTHGISALACKAVKFEEELKVNFSLYSQISEIKEAHLGDLQIQRYECSLVCLTFRFTMTNADVLNLETTIIEATPLSLWRNSSSKAPYKLRCRPCNDEIRATKGQVGRRLGQMAGQTCSFKAEDESDSPGRLNWST